MIEPIRRKLNASIDEKYRDFNRSLVPGEIAPMLGVRMPHLREIAKEIAKNSGSRPAAADGKQSDDRTESEQISAYQYIEELLSLEKAGRAFHEELLLHGMVIGYLKCDMETRKQLLDEFVPVINNWAVCDSCCMTYKFMKKDQEEWFPYLKSYVQSSEEYKIRFAVVCFLDHFVNEDFIARVLSIMGEIKHEGYYVKMAVAWAVSVCYVKFPQETESLFEENKLDDFTHNKAIQKIRESYRVSKEEKDRLNLLKRQASKDLVKIEKVGGVREKKSS